MQVLELSINFLTIYSLLIGLGLFTDNAVVIIQGFTSIYRSKKFSPLEAALLTWRDYATQLFSINLLTVWAFLPLLTLSGIIGEFIKPMPIIVSVAMMSSVFIALLFTLPSIKLLVDLKLPTRVVFLFRFLLASFILISAVLIIPRNILYVPSLLTFIVLVVNIVILRRELLREIKNKIKSNGEIERLAILFRKTFSRGLISLDRLTDYYRGALQRIIERPSRRKKVLLVIGIFTVFSYLLFPLGYVKNEFFPKSGSDRLYITLELPLGTNKETSEAEARKLIPNFLNHPAVEFITAEIGKGYNNGFDLTQPESNNVLFTIYLIPESERKNSLIISDEFRQTYADYNKGKIKVLDANVGPPAGADLDIRIIGEDLDELQKIAVNIEQFLDKLEGTANIEKSIKPGKTKIVFEPNKEALLAEGIQESQIGFWLRSHITGLDVKRVNFEGDEINTVIRVDKDLLTPEMLSLVEISKEGKNIPISQLGNFYLAPNPNLIPHNDGERTITVTASAETGFNPVQLNKSLENYVKNELELPDGYSWEFGGVNQENMEANQGILVAMVISSILILATMVVQLGSFRKALIVMLVIPLAISGVFILFALTATPLSFPASMGILSLFGIVIANSLMIVEKVTKNLKIGFSFEEAIPEAATSRIEPIILTSAAQIIGLIPATLADPIWRGFGGAIISGLAFSGLIMLFFIPVVYYYLFPELRKR
jgi:HAE1 family hydrophobic/amphiphilic exporter-1